MFDTTSLILAAAKAKAPCADRLSRVFDTTAASYKFYWFLSLLDLYVKKEKSHIESLDLAARMVAYAWQPIMCTDLSFGTPDSLESIVIDLSRVVAINDIDTIDVRHNKLSNAMTINEEVRRQVALLLNNVPYRFLSPWIPFKDNNTTILRSQQFVNGCLYALHGQGVRQVVEINPAWSEYLTENYTLLYQETLSMLAEHLHRRNPDHEDIIHQLLPINIDRPLRNLYDFWNTVVDAGGGMRCIFTDRELSRDNFNLNHFIPRQIVGHDHNWNILPTDTSFAECNYVPSLNHYLPLMAAEQHEALRVYIPRSKPNDVVLGQYQELGYTSADLLEMSDEKFLDTYFSTFIPLSQKALTEGYNMLQ